MSLWPEESEECLTKRCSKCKKDRPLSDFGPANGATYLRSECKECGRKLSKIRNQLKTIHGKPPIGYTCPICNRTEEQVKGNGGTNSGPWCLDHDHIDHTFRAWLCHTCNKGIGYFHDDISQLEKVINYLRKYKQ